MYTTQADLDIIATYMDDDIREALHGMPGLDTPSAFLAAYLDADPSFRNLLTTELRCYYIDDEV